MSEPNQCARKLPLARRSDTWSEAKISFPLCATSPPNNGKLNALHLAKILEKFDKLPPPPPPPDKHLPQIIATCLIINFNNYLWCLFDDLWYKLM